MGRTYETLKSQKDLVALTSRAVGEANADELLKRISILWDQADANGKDSLRKTAQSVFSDDEASKSAMSELLSIDTMDTEWGTDRVATIGCIILAGGAALLIMWALS